MEMGRKTLMLNASLWQSPVTGPSPVMQKPSHQHSFICFNHCLTTRMLAPPALPPLPLLPKHINRRNGKINKDLASASGKPPLQVPIYAVVRLELVGFSFHGKLWVRRARAAPWPWRQVPGLTVSLGRLSPAVIARGPSCSWRCSCWPAKGTAGALRPALRGSWEMSVPGTPLQSPGHDLQGGKGMCERLTEVQHTGLRHHVSHNCAGPAQSHGIPWVFCCSW